MTTAATLPPSITVALATTADGAIFALRQGSGDVTRIDGPAAKLLTPAAIAAALGVPGGAGQIVAIAGRDDGKLAFAFIGDAPRPTTSPSVGGPGGSLRLAAIGTFDSATGAIFAGVDHLTLASTDPTFVEAGTSPPTLIVMGDDAWLWRTHADGQMRLLIVRGLSALQPATTARDVTIGASVDLVEQRAWEWSATDEAGRFLLTDTAARWIRRLGEAGLATHVARFDDPVVAAISPATLDAAGRVIVLARDREGTVRSLLAQDGTEFREIAATRFTLDGKSLDQPLRIDRLVPVPGKANAFVAYDATSGRVLRVAAE